MLVRRDDERVPIREVAIQGPDPDAGARRDGLQGDVLAFLGERLRRSGEQFFPVALRVGAQRTVAHGHRYLPDLTKWRYAPFILSV